MEYIDDLSFSNIVNLIQGEEIKAADMINTFALELEEVRDKIVEAEKVLNILKTREAGLIGASTKIAKHIKKQLPLTVSRHKYLVIVSGDDLLIDRNVI